jgi:hypothetical protein
MVNKLKKQYEKDLSQKAKDNPKAMPELIINEEIVLKQLNSLKIDKSPEPDELHPSLLKEQAKSLTKPLCIIFKQPRRLKMIPKKWKKATISTIFNKGNAKRGVSPRLKIRPCDFDL